MGASSPTGNMFSLRNPFTRVLLLTLFFVIIVIYTLRPATDGPRFTEHLTNIHNISVPSQSKQPAQQHQQPHVPELDCSINATELTEIRKRYDLGRKLSYGQRYVRYIRQDIERQSITNLSDMLFPKGFDLIDTKHLPKKSTCIEPLEVPVTNSACPSTVNASDFLFGISTTFKRIVDPTTNPLKEWAHWLTDGQGRSNGAGLVLRLIDASPKEIEHTKDMITSLGIDVKVYASDSSVQLAKRYLSLLPALYNDDTRPSRKWLAMCDDDTFFPSMHALIKRLSAYDHTTDLYIGTLSDDVNDVQRHGSQAFGGAGVFFTVSVAEQVAKRFDECSTPVKIEEADSGWGSQGDILLRKCLYEHTEIRLTLLRELHQLDISGDISGFYESGLQPLSLHHFKGGMWHIAYPYESSYVIHACGEDCFLQRFQTADNFIISNGYSVAYYPNGIDFNLDQIERTFFPLPDDHGWNFDFMLGPQRKNLLWTGRKAAWELKESHRTSDGGLKQVYIRKADDNRWTVGEGGEPMFDVDGVMELIWIP